MLHLKSYLIKSTELEQLTQRHLTHDMRPQLGTAFCVLHFVTQMPKRGQGVENRAGVAVHMFFYLFFLALVIVKVADP